MGTAPRSSSPLPPAGPHPVPRTTTCDARNPGTSGCPRDGGLGPCGRRGPYTPRGPCLTLSPPLCRSPRDRLSALEPAKRLQGSEAALRGNVVSGKPTQLGFLTGQKSDSVFRILFECFSLL